MRCTALESIQRQALKGWKDGGLETEGVKAFKQIFGWKRACVGDSSMAASVLCDFVDEFPDGKTNGKSSRKQRGKIDL